MACGSCNKTQRPAQVRRIVQAVVDNTPCTYTIEILNDWYETLRCAKNSGFVGIKTAKLNSYLGIVKSAINYNSNPCYFRTSLSPIENIITIIKDNSEC